MINQLDKRKIHDKIDDNKACVKQQNINDNG